MDGCFTYHFSEDYSPVYGYYENVAYWQKVLVSKGKLEHELFWMDTVY